MYASFKILYGTAVFGLLMSGASFAQDKTGEVEELKKEVQELKKEITALRAEFKGMRGDIMKAVAAMKSGKKPAPRQRPAMTMLGKKAPQFDVTTVDGKKTVIGGKREKPQVVFCYASWCGYCKKSLPWIDSLHKKYADKGVEVLALNLDSRGEGGRSRTEEQTLKHFQDLKSGLPMTMTTGTNDTSKIGVAYKAQSFPTLFVLGQSGEVESVHVGAKQGLADTVGKELDILLQGKNRTAFPK
jgi:thiol-disulfide isomerase/thioredoxin